MRVLVANLSRLHFPDGQLAPLLCFFSRRGENEIVFRANSCKERLKFVVVFLQDRIELVIVTPGTSVGRPEKDRSDSVGDVIEDFLPSLPQVSRVALVRVMPVEAGRYKRVGTDGPQLITRELLLHESVIGLVFVERFDHIVTITPCVRPSLISLEPFALRIARKVEPVPRP